MLTRFAMMIWSATVDSRAYATDFVRRGTGSALGYLYALTTTLAFFGLLPFAISLAVVAPYARPFVDTQLIAFQQWYPDELEVTIQDGTLGTNVEEPYVLDLPEQWRDVDEELPAHAIVIDTDATVDDFDRYDTAILLTEKSAIIRDENGLRVFQFSEVDEDIVINEELVQDIAEGVGNFTPLLPWLAGGLALLLILVLPFVVGGLVWLFDLFFLLWATAVVWLISSVMSRTLSYGTLYRLGVYGLTSSVLVAFAFGMIGIGLWFVSWILFFVWMTVVLSAFPASARLAPPSPPAATTKKPSAPRKTKSRAKPQKSA